MVEAIQRLEQTVLEMEFAVILRYGMFYGPGTWYARDGWIAQEIIKGAMPMTPAITSFVHVDDAARAAALALDWPRGPVNIVDDDPAPATIWMPIYAAALGAPTPKEGMDDSTTRGASNDKAKYRLGWQLVHPTWRNGMID
jgi:nucleoside-diphosphate-sugar epimerase